MMKLYFAIKVIGAIIGLILSGIYIVYLIWNMRR